MPKDTESQLEARQALEEVLASPVFARSHKQSAFLRFVVEYGLDHGESPSGFAIAVDCFARSPDDPNDAYVRNIASQTRKSLRNYYADLDGEPSHRLELAEKGYGVQCIAIATAALAEPASARPAPTRVDSPEDAAALAASKPHKLLPTIAVLPLQCRSGDAEHAVLGHLLSDALITSLAKSRYLRVISRRTSAQFSQSEHSTTALGEMLNTDYLVEGSFYVHGDSLVVQIELCSCDIDEVIWAEKLRSTVEAVVSETDTLVDEILYGVTQQLLNHELQRAISTPLSSLKCHSLLIGGINIMHRSSPSDIARAREMLELLATRNPYHATPKSYLAYWGLLKIIRDSSNHEGSVHQSFVWKLVEQALEIDSRHPIALTAQGLSKSHFDKDFLSSRMWLEQALAISPNEVAPMGRMAIAKLYTDTPKSAYSIAEKAIATSPFDPELYFFHTAAAFAHFAEENHLEATTHAERSHELFPNHPSNLRILVGSHVATGNFERAKSARDMLLSSMPNFSIDDYLRKTPSPNHSVIRKLAGCLSEAGLP